MGIKTSLLEEIILYANRYDVDKLILFGSRARGDYRRTSDIDIAFSGGESSRFILSLNEDVNTLLEFDVVDLSEKLQQQLRDAIDREGIVLYEKV